MYYETVIYLRTVSVMFCFTVIKHVYTVFATELSHLALLLSGS